MSDFDCIKLNNVSPEEFKEEFEFLCRSYTWLNLAVDRVEFKTLYIVVEYPKEMPKLSETATKSFGSGTRD